VQPTIQRNLSTSRSHYLAEATGFKGGFCSFRPTEGDSGVVVGGDRNNPHVRHSDRGTERGEFEMLPMLLWAVVVTREREVQRIVGPLASRS
jgi:hypothetical protein